MVLDNLRKGFEEVTNQTGVKLYYPAIDVEDCNKIHVISGPLFGGGKVETFDITDRKYMEKMAAIGIAYSEMMKRGLLYFNENETRARALNRMIDDAIASGKVKDLDELAGKIGYNKLTILLMEKNKVSVGKRLVCRIEEALGSDYKFEKWCELPFVTNTDNDEQRDTAQGE